MHFKICRVLINPSSANYNRSMNESGLGHEREGIGFSSRAPFLPGPNPRRPIFRCVFTPLHKLRERNRLQLSSL